jgi:hypothetical protein
MVASKSIHLAFSLLFVMTSAYSQSTDKIPGTIKLQVLEVRVLKGNEASRRAPHSPGTDAAVRLRLSNAGSDSVYFDAFDTPDNQYIPITYNGRKTGSGVVWLYGNDTVPKGNPDVELISAGLPTKWVILPPRSAVEWEELDSTRFENEQHAFTLFLKTRLNSEPIELVSDFFSPSSPSR